MSKIEIIDVEPQDIEATQETVLDNDYILIDGLTNGTRKIKIENLGE